MDTDLARAISQSPFLSLLPAEDVRRLVGYSRPCAFDTDAVLFRAGDPGDRFHLVISGSVGLCGGGPQDEGAVLDLVGAGELAGEEAVFDRGAHGMTAQALLPVRTLAVEAAPFFRHMDDRFEVVQALLAGSSSRLRGMIHEITELKLRSTTRRLANFLVGLTGERRQGPARLALPCEKHQLAERLGMKPESLSRSFAKLRAYGVVSGRNDDVVVEDVDVLRRYSSSDFDLDS